jgi:protein TonB
MQSLTVPAMEAGWSTAAPGPAVVAAGYALFADRGYTPGPAPARFALVADRSVPKGPLPPQYSLVAEREPEAARRVEVRRRHSRWLYLALLLALAIHLGAVWTMVKWPGGQEYLGTEDGLPDQVNVSVISAAELDRLSSDPFLRQASLSPAPQSDTPPSPPPEPELAPPPPPPEPQPPQQEAATSFTPSPSKAEKTQEFDAAGFIAMASAQFSTQIDQAFKAAETRREHRGQARREAKRVDFRGGSITAMRPGATHKGRSDEFAKEVIWALAAVKPQGNGKYGTVIVTFQVSDAGRVEGLRMIKSSGDNWLDTAALMSVRQARMPKPPEPLPGGDRTFNIEYISMEGR